MSSPDPLVGRGTHVIARDALDRLLKLYRPNIPNGNYPGDVAHRGGNRTLRQSIVALGLASEAEVVEHFHRLDMQSYEAGERRLARFNAERGPIGAYATLAIEEAEAEREAAATPSSESEGR